MNEITKIRELILDRLQQPFVVDDKVLHFIESSLGLPPEEINEHTLEEYGIIDLIVVPDNQFRKVIEPYIPIHGISDEGIKEIVANVQKSITSISLDIAGRSIKYSNTSINNEFIQKLYLKKENIAIPDNEVLLDKYIAARVAIRVYIKNHDLQILKKMTDALVTYNDETILYDAIKLFTHIVYGNTDIYTALSIHKQRLQKQLFEMYEFQRLMQVYSMEYLMSVRKTAAFVDPQSILYQVTLIDKMSIALFGIPARGFMQDYEIDYGNIHELFTI